MIDTAREVQYDHPIRRSRAVLAPFLAAALAGAPLAAQQDTVPADSSVIHVRGIVVQGVRPVSTSGGASAMEVRIDSMPVPPLPTLDHVLREMPLVQVRQNSRGESQLSLRGAEERQIAILVDGVPLTLGWDHRTDLSVLPTTAVQQVTVVRGLSSVLHGPNVLGGVVEMDVARSPLGMDPPEPVQILGGLDHTGARTLGLTGGRRIDVGDGAAVLRAGAGYRERDRFPNARGLDPSELAGVDGRANSDFEHVDAFLAGRLAAEDGKWLSLSASGFHAERGVPPELHESSPRLWRYPGVSRVVAAMSGGTGQRPTFLGGVGDLEASIGLDFGDTEINEYATAAYDRVQEIEDSQDRTLTFRLLGESTLGDDVTLRTAATYADVSHDETIFRLDRSERITGAFPGEYRQRLWSLGSELAVALGNGPGDALISGGRLTLGAAADGSDTPETGGLPEREGMWEWGARIGATAFGAGGDLLLHAGASRRGRFPALRELYSTALGRFEPNPTLGPEILTAVEGGFTTSLKELELQLVGFHQRLSDAIVRRPGRVARFRRVNRDEIRSTGIELLATWASGPLALEGDLTVQDVNVSDPEAPAAEDRVVEYEPTLAGGLNMAIALDGGFRADGRFDYTSEQLCVAPDEADGFARIDPNTRLDLQLARTFTFSGNYASFTSVDMVMAVDNIGDSAWFDQCGLPQPGRVLRVQFRLW